MPSMTVSNVRALVLSRRFFWILFSLGLLLRLIVAAKFQTRAWIDEIWVVANPAYKLFSEGFVPGIEGLRGDWTYELRSWLPPVLLALFLRFLKFIGLENGLVVLPIVRMAVAATYAISLIPFFQGLQKKFSLKHMPLLPLLVAMFTPEFLRFGGTLDLSTLALPFLLAGFGIFWSGRPAPYSNILAFALLGVASLIRYQFAVVPFVLLVFFLIRKNWKQAALLGGMAIAAAVTEFLLNSWLYGKAIFPFWNYLYWNTVGGMATGFGVTPFYFGFELFWRFITEPVFLVCVAVLPLFWKASRELVCLSWGLLLVHCFIGHKEYRFFYGPAVLLSTLSMVIFQKWLTVNWKKKPATLWTLSLFVMSFSSVALWRAEMKADWRAYETPSYLETFAGAQTDVTGVLTVGWGGIYSGGGYTVYRPIPYASAMTANELRKRKINPILFNHVIVPTNWEPPCEKRIKDHHGGSLFRCDIQEIMNFLEEQKAYAAR